MTTRHGLDYYDERPNGITAALCVCGEEFAGTGGGSAALELLRAHFEVKQPMPPEPQGSGSVWVILAHTTDASGLKGTVVVGPFMTTYEVLKARHELQLAGAECEVASLQSLAQFQRATQPAEDAAADLEPRRVFASERVRLAAELGNPAGEHR